MSCVCWRCLLTTHVMIHMQQAMAVSRWVFLSPECLEYAEEVMVAFDKTQQDNLWSPHWMYGTARGNRIALHEERQSGSSKTTLGPTTSSPSIKWLGKWCLFCWLASLRTQPAALPQVCSRASENGKPGSVCRATEPVWQTIPSSPRHLCRLCHPRRIAMGGS